MRNLGRILITLAGIAVAVYLVAEQGFDNVLHALDVAGWSGLASISLLHIVPTAICGIAWWLLVRTHSSNGWFLFAWVRWIRDGLNGVVPFLPVSGELIGTRILALRGIGFAGASIIVDLTAELLGQVLFAAIAFGLLIVNYPDAPDKPLIAAAIGIVGLQFTGFLIAQRKGLFRLLERPLDWFRKSKRAAQTDADRSLHGRILIIYGDHKMFAGSVFLHLVAWFVTALETWVGLWFMGHPLNVVDVFTIEGLVYAIRAVGFFVPLSAGVQEGGFVLIGGLVGLAPDLALAVSLLRRGRELVVGVPALLAWQLIEARHFRRSRSRRDKLA